MQSRGPALGIPCKTAAGHAELVTQERRLSQRHRTLLLLVDGTRTLDEVIALGRQLGVPRGCIDELFALGLIVIGAPPMASPPGSLDRESGFHDPASPDTVGFGPPMTATELARLDADDVAFARAREAVLLALRSHAPVTGAVTMLRVRRARSRAELQALLPDVRARLDRSQQQAEVRRRLTHIESLLSAL
ncbi:MAG: hypothetical protein RL456_2302 [Pseudomonadota bacterium]